MVLNYKGCAYFRQRIICATLSGKPIVIDEIRPMEENPGLRDYEVNFLKLLNLITNGTTIDINPTGTRLKYKPGVITGGAYLQHDCGTERGIGYFIEGLIPLSLFSKKSLSIILTGITNNQKDLSVDVFRNVTLNLLDYFGLEEKATLVVNKRGAPPNGGGEVLLKIPIARQLQPIQILEEGMIKRIRGIAYATRLNPQTANRMVTSARALLNKWIPDVYIYTDSYKGKAGGKSPGYAIFLVAESDTGVRLCTEYVGGAGIVPEDIGEHCSRLLAEEIYKGGCIDSHHQWLMLLLMSLTTEDVSKLRIGKLTNYSINMLRHIKDFFGVTFKLEPEHETRTVQVSCLGSGFKNLSRKAT